ncbi:MAG: hypothetical protein GTN89_03710 [Acidobacteria bacterium]|nr:hypothetical protein [Acidobacteriota bacterium]NIQ29485.1 hypothetical protein [Acidobacteriota bacterium]NIQ84162.1 hypothetical protein [Acidobacteriota bacterium]
MNCSAFKRDLYHFQAEELSPAERAACLDHADLCAPCARLLEVEQGLLRGLKARLTASPHPPGLETRIREQLREAGRARQPGIGWVRRPWFAALAASVLLAVLVLPQFDSGPSPVTRVGPRIVTVVDFDCDKFGADFGQQRLCTHPRHLNALKLEDGGYWQISADGEVGRELITDRDLRGTRMRVEGWLYERIHTLQVDQAVPAGVQAAQLISTGH